jgi:YHS domain-containing protein
MPAPTIADYLKFANLQMAAESLFGLKREMTLSRWGMISVFGWASASKLCSLKVGVHAAWLAGVLLLQGCGTPYATMRNAAGEEVMLLGHDPVAYFTVGKPLRGDPAIKSSLPDRTYYFASAGNKALFDASPQKYEPQYGGFCASGAAFALKLGSDPTEFEIVDGRLFIFGDILGHQAWSIDPSWNIRHGDEVWPEARDEGWRGQSLRRYGQKVAWYKDTAAIRADWAARFPGRAMADYDPGGMITNLFLKTPGWRAREGFGQPAVGFVGEDPCPPACIGQVSKRFGD